MKRIYILITLVLLVIVALYIPVNEQKTVEINASFFKVYRQLIGPGSWVKWHPGLKTDFEKDSTKISFITKNGGYEINSPERKIAVNFAAGTFNINDSGQKGTNEYSYTVEPNKTGKKTVVEVDLNTNILGYLQRKFGADEFKKTYIANFKNYIEVDSLFYGYHIYRVRVPQSDLITIRKKALAINQFIEAEKSYQDLKKFIATKHLAKMQPVIAQYIPVTNTDSVQVNVGFFIDKPIKSEANIIYVKMPRGGPLWVIDYKGKFNERKKAYAAMNRFFVDHIFETAVMPFETYFDDKLPKSETEIINMRINNTSFQ